MTYGLIAVGVLVASLVITGLCAWGSHAWDSGILAAIGFFTGVVFILELTLIWIAAMPVIGVFFFHLIDLIPGH
jgi:hypothetical protein